MVNGSVSASDEGTNLLDVATDPSNQNGSTADLYKNVGGNLFHHENFNYGKNKSRGDSTYLRCALYRKMKCQATAKLLLQNNQIVGHEAETQNHSVSDYKLPIVVVPLDCGCPIAQMSL